MCGEKTNNQLPTPTVTDGVKHMSIKEFRALGYLQELNRQFLHPLGLAMEAIIDDDGKERLGGVWDYRDDPEGMRFGGKLLKSKEFQEKMERIAEIQRTRKKKFKVQQ